MNKKRWFIIIIALFLIIGTSSFVFANQEQDEFLNQTEKKEETPTKKETLTDKNSQTNKESNESIVENSDENSKLLENDALLQELHIQNNNNLNQNVLPTQNPSREENHKPENSENTNQSQVTQQIMNINTKLIELSKSLENITNIVELEIIKKTGLADLIANQISSLPNSEIKQQLLEKLTEILKIINDQTKPIIKGIEPGETINTKNPSIIIEEENISKIILNGKIITINDLKNLPDGTYELIVIDKSFNTTKIVFMIDTTAPIIKGVINDAYYNALEKIKITVEDQSETKIYISKDGQEFSNYQAGNLIEEDGTYLVYAKDIIGNESEKITFTKDTISPTATISYSNKNKTNQSVIVELLNPSEEIKIINNNGSNIYEFTENGEFTYEFMDLAGNKTMMTATVDNIDKIAPEYKEMGILNLTNYQKQEDSTIASQDDEIVVFITFDELLKTEPNMIINGQNIKSTLLEKESEKYVYIAKYTRNKEIYFEGNIEVIVKDYADEAGNVGKELTNTDINHETYSHVYMEIQTGYFNTNKIVIQYPNFDHMTISTIPIIPSNIAMTIYENTYEIDPKKSNYTYDFTIYSKDNQKLKRFILYHDDKKPVITGYGIINGKSQTLSEKESYEEVNLNLKDNKNLQKIKKIKEDGTEEILKEFDTRVREFELSFKEKGFYNIIVIDKAGNESQISFTIN